MAKGGAGGAVSSGRGTNATSGGMALSTRTRNKILNAPGHRENGILDGAKVSASTLGLAHGNAFPTGLSNRTKRMEVSLSKISLGRPALDRERLLRAAGSLRNGIRARGKRIEPIRVAQKRDGSFVVQGDGNHRIAALRLMGYRGKVPVVARLQREAGAK